MGEVLARRIGADYWHFIWPPALRCTTSPNSSHLNRVEVALSTLARQYLHQRTPTPAELTAQAATCVAQHNAARS
ncbi:MAG: hypothetical protein EOO56_18780 [Hymenobacter sp.]|nr:MAG: hypothetical protein EOO56_18780 [Hymenobacter sp.]